MDTQERKQHWDTVFTTKDTAKVSWHQRVPGTSLQLIENMNLPLSAKIIEAGCGDSYLADFLIEKGYSDITLLDISEKAIQTLKNRLGKKSEEIKWITADVAAFCPAEKYNIWHDRAVFHFLLEETDIQNYVKTASENIIQGGYLIIGTFSDNGPDKCSGLNVKQYSETNLTDTFHQSFKKIRCFTENHQTPSGGSQNFLFCVFQKN